MAFHLCVVVCFFFVLFFFFVFFLILVPFLVARVPFPFGVWDRMCNSIVSVPEHCLFIYFTVPNVCQNRRPYEPSQEIMVLFVLRKLILQMGMRSHPVGLDVWFFVRSFVYCHTSCVRTAKALARLRGCTGSPEPLLIAYVINTIISWAGSYRTQTLFQFSASPSSIRHNGKCNICAFHEDIHAFEDWIFVRLSSLVLASEWTINRKKFIVLSIDFVRFLTSEGSDTLILHFTYTTGGRGGGVHL